jgi:hypothetical protein
VSVLTRNPVTESRLYKIYIKCAANSATAVHSTFFFLHLNLFHCCFMLDSSIKEVTIRRTHVESRINRSTSIETELKFENHLLDVRQVYR